MSTTFFSAVMALTALTALSCNSMAKSDKAGYSGRDLAGEFEILRDKDTKDALLTVNANTQWKLYSGPSVDSIDFAKPLITGSKGIFDLNVPDSVRSYFQVITPDGGAILAERLLPMAGGYNFRDMGGFRTKDGRYVKWGKVFRSDDMHNLTSADLRYLSSIPLVSVVDFRSDTEIQSAPDKLAGSVEGHYLYSITPGDLQQLASGETLPTEDQLTRAMEDVNRMLVTEKDAIGQYRKFFELLEDETKVPLVFHCSAGKDRTGMGAALFLAALGVDDKVIMDDYLSSNKYLSGKYDFLITEYPQLEPLMTVRKEYLQAGLDQIRETYGSIDEYLSGTLGVDLEKIKETYLY